MLSKLSLAFSRSSAHRQRLASRDQAPSGLIDHSRLESDQLAIGKPEAKETDHIGTGDRQQKLFVPRAA